jgi:hypothetical protein
VRKRGEEKGVRVGRGKRGRVEEGKGREGRRRVRKF